MKRKLVAVILALFAGSVGAHRFYLRQPELGIAYIALFVWFGRFFGFSVSTLLGWYDAYKFMIMDDSEFDRRYNSHYFRDRYGRRIDEPKERKAQKKGRYILLDENKYENKKQPSGYFKKLKRTKEAEMHKQLGIKKFKDFDTKGAIEEFKKALSFNPEDLVIHFNIACAYSIEENAYEAFNHLDLAVRFGLKDVGNILKHEAFAFIRVMPEFEAFKKNNFQLDSQLAASIKKSMELHTESERMELKTEIPIVIKSPAT